MADQNSTVYVGNVDSRVDEATLRAVFDNCGVITGLRVAGKPGLHTVFCFVQYEDASQALLALAMDGLQLGERQIKVSLAKEPPQRQQYLDNRIALRDRPRVQPVNLLQAEAQARLLSLNPSLQFASLVPLQQTLPLQQALVARPLLSQTAAQRPKRPHQDPDKVERTIYIENIAEDVDEQVLADHFGVCGTVTAVRVAGTGPGLRKAWVEFDQTRQAQSAKEYDQTGLGSAIIRVRQSKTAIHTNGLHESRGGYYVPGPSPRPNSPDADGSNGSYPNGHRQQRPAAIGLRREDEFNSYPSDRRRFQRSPHSSPADFRRGNFEGGYEGRPDHDREGKRLRI